MGYILTFILYFGNACLEVTLAKQAFYSRFKTNKALAWIGMILSPTLIATFRGYTGSDSGMYINSYYYLQSVSENRWNGFELGYQKLIQVLNGLHLSYHALFFIISFFTVLFFLLFINNEKDEIDYQIAVLVFSLSFYLFSLNGMRQALAISIDVYAISEYLYERRVKSFFLVLIGGLFHISSYLALIVILARIIYENKHYKKWIIISTIMAFVLVINREILGELAALLTNRAYALYILSDAGDSGSVINYIFRNIIPIIIILMYLRAYKLCGRMKTYAALILIGYALIFLSVFTGTQASRLGLNYMYLSPVVLGFCCKYDALFGGKMLYRVKKRNIKYILIAYELFYCIYVYFIVGDNQIVPYIPS